jgi:hypothetical protein
LAGELMRRTGVSGILDTKTGINRIVTELQTPPFGFVLLIDSPPPEKYSLLEFTDFLDGRKKGEEISFLVKVPVFESNTQMPLDYRKKHEILRKRIEQE